MKKWFKIARANVRRCWAQFEGGPSVAKPTRQFDEPRWWTWARRDAPFAHPALAEVAAKRPSKDAAEALGLSFFEARDARTSG